MTMDFKIDGEAEAMALSGRPPDSPRLSDGERRTMLIYGGVALTLCQFAVPYEGLIGLPVVFFLKNRLHMSAHDVALFNLLASIPLFVGFAFGFLRDVWSPLGRGDRGFMVIFAPMAAAAYGVLAARAPSYGLLLGGVLAVTIGLQFVFAALRGATSMLSQEEAITGQASVMGNLAVLAPNLAAYFLGGALSQYLEGRDAVTAARLLFGLGAALMAAVAILGAFGPRRLLDAHHARPRDRSAAHDIARLFRHRPLYPVMAIQLLWQFAPAAGAVLQFHLSNDLHATDAQVGAWFGIFMGAFTPVMFAYGWLCRRVRLRTLLWVGAAMAVVQMSPLLFVRNPTEALVAAAVIGLIGGLAQAAFTDLAIRACPPGLQGAMMMMFVAMFFVSLRFGDLLGAWLYDRQGGFQTAVFASIAAYAAILLVLPFVPKALTRTVDGETISGPSEAVAT